jgi:hypothetical protein
LDLVKDRDVTEVARLPDVKGSEAELDDNWDVIV